MSGTWRRCLRRCHEESKLSSDRPHVWRLQVWAASLLLKKLIKARGWVSVYSASVTTNICSFVLFMWDLIALMQERCRLLRDDQTWTQTHEVTAWLTHQGCHRTPLKDCPDVQDPSNSSVTDSFVYRNFKDACCVSSVHLQHPQSNVHGPVPPFGDNFAQMCVHWLLERTCPTKEAWLDFEKPPFFARSWSLVLTVRSSLDRDRSAVSCIHVTLHSCWVYPARNRVPTLFPNQIQALSSISSTLQLQ